MEVMVQDGVSARRGEGVRGKQTRPHVGLVPIGNLLTGWESVTECESIQVLRSNTLSHDLNL